MPCIKLTSFFTEKKKILYLGIKEKKKIRQL